MRNRRRWNLAALAAVAVLCTACGGEGDSAEGARGDGPATTAGEPDCSAFSRELLDRWGLERQLVLNLSMAGGSNLATMRDTMSVPDPATFRTLAGAFEGLDTSGIERMEAFDPPEQITDDLRRTAAVLEAALAAGGDTEDPAWTALSEFYTQKFFVRHNSSISYYLREAGCV